MMFDIQDSMLAFDEKIKALNALLSMSTKNINESINKINSELYVVKNNINELKEKIENLNFNVWYINVSYFKKLIWKIKRYDKDKIYLIYKTKK